MKYCKLDTAGEVVQTQPYLEDGFIKCDNSVVCGMVYDGITFSIKPKTEAELIAIAEALSPKVVTMRQARLALLESGMLSAIDNAITVGTDEALKIEWEYATEVRRDWKSLMELALAMGITTINLDNLFVLASTK